MHKLFDNSTVQLQHTNEVFYYDIGYTSTNLALSSFFKYYIFNSSDSSSSNYYSILSKFYLDQSMSTTTASISSNYIIPSSLVKNNFGSTSANSVILFTFDSNLAKDGISNINSEKNILINLNAINYNYNLSAFKVFDLNSGASSSLTYQLYDKKNSLSAGDIILNVLSNNSLSSSTSTNTYISNIVVGKIFYDYSLIILDSLTNFNTVRGVSLNGNTLDYYIPYPYIQNNSNKFTPSSYINGTIYNLLDTYISPTIYNISSNISNNASLNTLIINDIAVNFNINKNSYFLTVPISSSEFNYSNNPTSKIAINSFNTLSTEGSPLYFAKVGFYDYKNNLIAIGKISMPIKKTNSRNINLTFKLDT